MKRLDWKATLWLSVCLAVVLALPLRAQAEAELVAGPMVGHTDAQSSRIWVQTDEPAQVQIEYWEKDSVVIQRSATLQTASEAWMTAQIPLPGLRPGRVYQYRVVLDGVVQPRDYPLEFRTPSGWQPGQQAPDFQVLTGSCYYVNDDWMKLLGIEYGGSLQIFSAMARHPADLMLWLGDNVYLSPLDISNRWRMNARYRKQRSQAPLQPLLARMPHYAIWDDHDFGPNNSSRLFPLAEVSLELFQAYWANPRYGLLTEKGTWSRFSWHDADFFLTDGRFYRDPLSVSVDQRRMLGVAQLNWLKTELRASRAPFKLIAVGSPVFNLHYDESFTSYPREFQELMDFIQAEKITGVVFLSGDRHHSDLHKISVGVGYPLFNYTSSPLTSAPTRVMSSQELNDPQRVPGTLTRQHNYGLLKFSGPSGDRRLTLETRGGAGQLLWEYTLSERELRFPAS